MQPSGGEIRIRSNTARDLASGATGGLNGNLVIHHRDGKQQVGWYGDEGHIKGARVRGPKEMNRIDQDALSNLYCLESSQSSK
jgi:hypothetical protein